MSDSITQWLENLGIVHQGMVLHNPNKSHLVAESLQNNEGELTDHGALGVITTPYTGRSPNDKFIVDHPDQSNLWWGDFNRPMTIDAFNQLQNRVTSYLSNRTLYIIDCFIGADPEHRFTVRVVSELAWQALFAQNLLIYNDEKHEDAPDMIILAAPGFNSHPEIDSVDSKAAIAINLKAKTVLIAGSKYAGEIKKSAFTIMNAILPESNVLPMHCSATVGESGDVALYFGLSGTGKTTLSSTPERKLVGDDEHGWGENGIFNFEGGCYAKTIRLSAEHEPVIWHAVNQYGTVLENVVISPENCKADFDDAKYTENSRAAYPLSRVANIIPDGLAGHPEKIFFLTADAFGVMPPIAKLTPDQAIYYFLSGYTSKIAGTERGLGKKPEATFSTGFGEPFLPLTPGIYAQLLKEKISTYNCSVWLVNTGWTAGDYNTGYRMPLAYTRLMINWILADKYDQTNFHIDPLFEIAVPDLIPGVPEELLYPEKTWGQKETFFEVAAALKKKFDENFTKFRQFL